jgi:hypothetical protein
MTKVRETSGLRRHNSVYLGPEGYTFPFQFTYAQYGLYGIATAIGVLIGAVAGSTLVVCWLLLPLWFCAALIWRKVDPDRPARKVVKTLALDCKRTPADAGVVSRHAHVTRVRFSTSQSTGPRYMLTAEQHDHRPAGTTQGDGQ